MSVETLSALQQRAIAALLEEPSIAAAARRSRASRRSIHRWLQEDPVFSAELDRRRQLAYEQTGSHMVSLTGQAVAAIEYVLGQKYPDTAHRIKLAAARLALQYADKYQSAAAVKAAKPG
ncbi:MAG: hypothetical protein GC160_24925 [Acidobacteria bacterium]|nr:hypothetical protein [Acidobacteriota bacterium]